MPVLYYVRHGETDYNVEGRLQGQHETALNARGREQAKFCGRLLGDLFARQERRIDDYAYVSSPLLRARETMEIMRATLGLDPITYGLDDRLKEIGYGEWEGWTLAEIMARDPHLLARREHDKWGFAPPGGESYRALARRVGSWYAGIARDTVVTAHAGIARALMTNLNVLPEAQAAHAEVAHGCIYVFSGRTMVRYA
jgi:probable phosphoglycerate mutase